MVSTDKQLPIGDSVKQPAQAEKSPATSTAWHPLESLRRQIDHLFEDMGRSTMRLPFGRSAFDVEPFWRRDFLGHGVPAVDIAEKDKSFEITVELPGTDEKDLEIRLANGNMIIRGEKREETEDKRKDYYLSERRYGAFERVFSLPKGVDVEAIEASVDKGVLTVSLPKKPEAIKPEKVIPVKAR
ncbi:Hsp20/alpha crystallin family protein [Pseudomonas sp. SP16.1]|uniref:Hsp20/alpha crystallin family protein n=1 Tax=Pseudomonas sp. SP16.1 TaxID=3458854 RepID=UPI00404548EC